MQYAKNGKKKKKKTKTNNHLKREETQSIGIDTIE